MMFLVVLRRSGPEYDHSKPLEEQSGWVEHAAFMDGLVDDGFIVLGGVLGDEVRTAHAVEAPRRTRSASASRGTRGAGRILVVDSIDPWTIRLDRALARRWRIASSTITHAAAAAASATSASEQARAHPPALSSSVTTNGFPLGRRHLERQAPVADHHERRRRLREDARPRLVEPVALLAHLHVEHVELRDHLGAAARACRCA